MRELYTEGVATRGGPEPCVGIREGVGEVLDRGTCRPAIEPRNHGDRGADAVAQKRKATSSAALSRVVDGPRAVGEPVHARNLHAREPGDPTVARLVDRRAGRSGKAKAVSLR